MEIREVGAVGRHSAPVSVELRLDLLLSEGISQVENLIDAIRPNHTASHVCSFRHTYQVHVLHKTVVNHVSHTKMRKTQIEVYARKHIPVAIHVSSPIRAYTRSSIVSVAHCDGIGGGTSFVAKADTPSVVMVIIHREFVTMCKTIFQFTASLFDMKRVCVIVDVDHVHQIGRTVVEPILHIEAILAVGTIPLKEGVVASHEESVANQRGVNCTSLIVQSGMAQCEREATLCPPFTFVRSLIPVHLPCRYMVGVGGTTLIAVIPIHAQFVFSHGRQASQFSLFVVLQSVEAIEMRIAIVVLIFQLVDDFAP